MKEEPREPQSQSGPVREFLVDQLGPACVERFRDPALQRELDTLLDGGNSLDDAVLRLIHREAAADRAIADEFLGHFLIAMSRIGHFAMSDGLRRFLDTGDLVNSVAGSVWRDLTSIEFRSRGEFLAYLGKRLQWKAADRARKLSAGKRREDRRREVDVEESNRTEKEAPGPSTLAEGVEERERLILALLRLPPRDRELLQRSLRGEDQVQIAESLGMSPEAVRKATQRAIEKARALV